MYKHSLVAKQQLEALGFVIDLQVVDWATLNQRVQKPELWEAYVTGYPLIADPALHVAFRCSFPGVVVQRREGAADRRAETGERPEEAQRRSSNASRRSTTRTWVR